MKRIVAIALAAVMAFGMVSVGLADGGGPVAVWDGSGSSGGEGSTTSSTDSKDTTVSTGELTEMYTWTLPTSVTLSAGTGIEVSGSVTATVEARLDDGHCIKLTAGDDSISMTGSAPADANGYVPSFTCYVGNGDTNSDDEYEANGSTDGLFVCEGGGTDTGTFYLFGECSTTGTYSGQLAVFAEITDIPTTTNIPNGGGTNAIA